MSVIDSPSAIVPRGFNEVSAPSTFDGSVFDYGGCNG